MTWNYNDLPDANYGGWETTAAFNALDNKFTNQASTLGNGNSATSYKKPFDYLKWGGIAGGALGSVLGMAQGYAKNKQYEATAKALKAQGQADVKLGQSIYQDALNSGMGMATQNINQYAMAGKDKEAFYQANQSNILGNTKAGTQAGMGLIAQGQKSIADAKKYKLSEWEKFYNVGSGALGGLGGGLGSAASLIGMFA